jgi:hypothetical protein
VSVQDRWNRNEREEAESRRGLPGIVVGQGETNDLVGVAETSVQRGGIKDVAWVVDQLVHYR